ncbi:putative arabinose efflux permease AraJ, MFS family [Cupriavidus necator]|uniref:MFS transporter n=1 Tax=Cupriavidus necator (strain ATCC 17699 / DSM 428 / KCTC 22496 / NCIMB 10442 / H16 / Stanier 337) TaxID=381666 RepID=Q0K242_CUPNH|nr:MULTISPECIES: MFS transporter [Cupriavidus]EON18408.1 MFS transporter [Cupriavidus sp. GA3-3]QCC03807.1 MFS transporter [Cupriavidus necator H16]QQB80865.1 MFS transporter [Cupriavidus necator]WKA45166.1 MFS transporter [Cupriavidus necator]CAJ95932.1 MFS transporter [Cupriavidus necator H16]
MTSRERRGMAAILIAVALATLDTAIANTALPSIAADLRATPAASVWVINAYQLAMVSTLLPFAALGGVVGHRRIYLGGVVLFTAASVVCALAWSLPTLAAARVLQGIGAAAIMSVNTALISAIFPTHRLGRGLGLNALVVGVSFAVGPTVASVILSFGTWPWLFAVNLPIGLLALAIGRGSLPQTPRSAHGFDRVAAGLSVVAFAALVLALGEGAQRAPLHLSLAAAGIFMVTFGLLLWRERGHPAPMLPVDLFRRPMFALSTLTAVCSFAAQGLAFVSLPFYFQHVLGRGQVETGFLLTPWSVVVALIGPLAGRLSDRYPPAVLGGVGLAVLSVGMLSLAMLPADPSALDIGIRMCICGAGFGFFQSPNLKALMTSAPRERSGGASGVVATARLLGQATGAALVALCFGIAGDHGPGLALALGAGFAGLAAIASWLRLAARDPLAAS